MLDFGQFPDTRTAKDYAQTYAEAKEFYGTAPMSIEITSCGNRAVLDMDGCGYRCTTCFAVVGGAACGCKQ